LFEVQRKTKLTQSISPTVWYSYREMDVHLLAWYRYNQTVTQTTSCDTRPVYLTADTA